MEYKARHLHPYSGAEAERSTTQKYVNEVLFFSKVLE